MPLTLCTNPFVVGLPPLHRPSGRERVRAPRRPELSGRGGMVGGTPVVMGEREVRGLTLGWVKVNLGNFNDRRGGIRETGLGLRCEVG